MALLEREREELLAKVDETDTAAVGRRKSEPKPVVQPEGHAYSVSLLAERWDCSGSHVRNLIARGQLQSYSHGKMIRIRRPKSPVLKPAAAPMDELSALLTEARKSD